jgi:hypothetical protein
MDRLFRPLSILLQSVSPFHQFTQLKYISQHPYDYSQISRYFHSLYHSCPSFSPNLLSLLDLSLNLKGLEFKNISQIQNVKFKAFQFVVRTIQSNIKAFEQMVICIDQEMSGGDQSLSDLNKKLTE